MNRRERRKALIAESRGIGEKAKAAGVDLTDDEMTRVEAIKGEVAELSEAIARDEKAREAIAEVTKGINDDEDPTPGQQVVGGTKASGITLRERTPVAETFGEAFVKSEAYTNFKSKFPSGVGSGSRIEIGRTHLGDFKGLGMQAKAAGDLLNTDVARIQPVRYPTMDMIDRPRLTLLDLISRGQMAGAFEYVQINGVTRRAAIVEEATGEVGVGGEDLDPLKPISTFQTSLADAKPFTYADGYEVTNQLLADAPAFATYLNTELGYSINTVIEDMLLNGTGLDGQPTGLLATTGVQQQALVTDMVTTVRKAITKINRVGGAINGVLMSPEADEAWDLLQDTTGRYQGQGPFGTGPGTAWGRPRIVSELLSGTNIAIVGDFRTIALLDREGLSIEAFNQHKDFAQRNKVYVRAELRAGQVIWRPNRLAVAQIGI